MILRILSTYAPRRRKPLQRRNSKQRSDYPNISHPRPWGAPTAKEGGIFPIRSAFFPESGSGRDSGEGIGPSPAELYILDARCFYFSFKGG
jgi:hypothetical protein